MSAANLQWAVESHSATLGEQPFDPILLFAWMVHMLHGRIEKIP
jgi:hypothetical protein